MNVSDMGCKENSMYRPQEIQTGQESTSKQTFSNQTALYFTVITYLPSRCAIAALLLHQITPFSVSPPLSLMGSCFICSLNPGLSFSSTSAKHRARPSLCITDSFHQCWFPPDTCTPAHKTHPLPQLLHRELESLPMLQSL